MTMSRTVRFMETGGPEVLRIDDIDIPAPGPNEVRIRARALGLNRAESMWRSGKYIEEPILPARLGYEAAGIIEAIGEGETGFTIGEAVSVVPAFSQNQYGMYGELVLAPTFAVVKNPPSLSFEEAASIWMMFITAYGALVDQAGLLAGETVVIPAASSSVGIAAIQVANMVGATSIALTRTSAKRAPLLDAGARHVIATEEQDLVLEILKITNGKGARVVFDPIGGPSFTKLLAASSPGATLILYGALSEEPTALPILEMLAKHVTIHANTIWTTSGDPVRLAKAKSFVLKGLEEGRLKPVIAKSFPFEDIIEAHTYLESNQQFGKLVVTL
ncbi:Quinone oxidoreductase [Acidisarcina polymorpha]|uniref:Quinone oxidoreductase n=2 Tax=Acidisarcina polymorpha TaxID=2211140 RepID=A0A2Z5FU70_9BACT|nr:Quinone oxidoreductase [Acidisarcina polymorpha]